LVIGIVIQVRAAATASLIQPFVKKATGIDTLVMLIVVVILFGKGFLSAVGTYAILAHVIFFTVITAASYALGFGMPPRQKSVVSLGICTRNNGAAMAPLFVAQGVDPNAIVMVSLGIPMMFVFAAIAARVFARRAGQPLSEKSVPGSPQTQKPVNHDEGKNISTANQITATKDQTNEHH